MRRGASRRAAAATTPPATATISTTRSRTRARLAAPLPLLDRAGADAYLDEVRHARRLGAIARAAFPTGDPLAARRLRARDAGAARGAAHGDDPADDPADRRPRLRAARAARCRAAARARRRRVPAGATCPAGPFLMGTDDRTLAYDNERPAHEVDVPRSASTLRRSRTAPVPRASCDDGGYRRRELWDEDGRDLARDARASRHPARMDPAARDGAWRRARVRPRRAAPARSAGRPRVLVRGARVRALGRQAPPDRGRVGEGRRVGPRARSCRAAIRGATRPPSPEHANLDQRCFAPRRASARTRRGELLRLPPDARLTCGSGPRATSRRTRASRRSRIPSTRRSTSARGYKVLRGGSWATQPIVARNTFRNWDLPQRRQIFAGFRCASDG